jgi:hypothetical protein
MVIFVLAKFNQFSRSGGGGGLRLKKFKISVELSKEMIINTYIQETPNAKILIDFLYMNLLFKAFGIKYFFYFFMYFKYGKRVYSISSFRRIIGLNVPSGRWVT